MGHLQAYRAAVDGKRHGNKTSSGRESFALARRLIVAAVTLFAASMSGSASYAQSGAFAGMAGNWSGGGTVTLDDGSTERIRCRASYAVSAGGNGLNQTLICASDSYKFNLAANVVAEGGALSGTWSESSRNVNGTLRGARQQRQFPGGRQRGRIYRQYLLDDARQQAVRRDQDRDRLQDRHDFAVAPLRRGIATRPRRPPTCPRLFLVRSGERRFRSWSWRSTAPAPW